MISRAFCLNLFEQGYRTVRRCYGFSCADLVHREAVEFVLKDGLLCRRLARPGGESDQVPVVLMVASGLSCGAASFYVMTWRCWILRTLHNTSSVARVGSAALQERVKDHCW